MTVTVGVRATGVFIKTSGQRLRCLVGSLVNVAGVLILLGEALEEMLC